MFSSQPYLITPTLTLPLKGEGYDRWSPSVTGS